MLTLDGMTVVDLKQSPEKWYFALCRNEVYGPEVHFTTIKKSYRAYLRTEYFVIDVETDSRRGPFEDYGAALAELRRAGKGDYQTGNF